MGHAGVPLGSLFWHVCVSVDELVQDTQPRPRSDLAASVGKAIQIKVDAVERGRRVLAEPECIRGDDPGSDRQLKMALSIKRQTINVKGEDWNLAFAGGASLNGLFQERDYLPSVILQRDALTDEQLVSALTDFVDRSVVEAVRRHR